MYIRHNLNETSHNYFDHHVRSGDTMYIRFYGVFFLNKDRSFIDYIYIFGLQKTLHIWTSAITSGRHWKDAKTFFNVLFCNIFPWYSNFDECRICTFVFKSFKTFLEILAFIALTRRFQRRKWLSVWIVSGQPLFNQRKF